MRDKSRIEPFLNKLGEYWKEVPDCRFGQLMVNFFEELNIDPFFLEEDKFLELLEGYMKQNIRWYKD